LKVNERCYRVDDMEILILRDCEVEMCVAEILCCEDCGYEPVHKKVQVFKDDEYDVDNYSFDHITESGLASLEEGVDWVSAKSYEAGRAYQRIVEMAMQAGKTVEEYFKANQ